jgi:predicted AAA+ superfamily ATPase
MAYIPRIVDGELDELMRQLAAIALEGPKGVGKTVTAERRTTEVRRLDDPVQKALAEADPAQVIRGGRPVLIDEWQHVPAVWDVVRRAVDGGAGPGSFLLAGSAAPVEAPTHSGAGRIVSIRMRPLSLAERGLAAPSVSVRDLLGGTRPAIAGTARLGLEGYAREIVNSGFPGVRHLTGRALRIQLDGYLTRIVDRDFEEQGLRVRRPNVLRRWMAAYAAATGTTASFEKIRDAATSGEGATPAKATVAGYRDTLEQLWILDPVPGWRVSRNQLARLTESPRHHLADPALAARLLDLDEGALLGRPGAAASRADGALFGRLFESLVTLSVRVYAQSAEARVFHLRTRDGREEVDLIVESLDRRVLALEVKLGGDVRDDDVRHLLWLRERLGDDLLDAVIVTTGQHAYRRPDGIAVVPAVLLGP